MIYEGWFRRLAQSVTTCISARVNPWTGFLLLLRFCGVSIHVYIFLKAGCGGMSLN